MYRLLAVLVVLFLGLGAFTTTATDAQSTNRWQSPPEDILEVLHAPQLPRVWNSPTGAHLLLADPVIYPPLSELAAPMHKLAGMRVNPVVNSIHGRHGATSPRLIQVEGRVETPLDLPADAEMHSVEWTADGQRFALTIEVLAALEHRAPLSVE